jgi:hypothetical protein
MFVVVVAKGLMEMEMEQQTTEKAHADHARGTKEEKVRTTTMRLKN